MSATTLTIDGNFYAVVRGEHGRFAVGYSGPPVVGFQQSFRLMRKLGFGGTDAELLHQLVAKQLPGSDFADGSGSSDFFLSCPGTYTATALVRPETGGGITGSRFWLRQGLRPHVTRAFCMPAQWLPVGARLEVTFQVPLTAKAPVFSVDWNADGKPDSLGPFDPGGARFPLVDRCE